mmetsp:Transcript_90/g.156  ORF Transcript_90/g.156 Transcript_90/m.156 type:complete len:248 (-) Transcript_90:438-1181(-)
MVCGHLIVDGIIAHLPAIRRSVITFARSQRIHRRGSFRHNSDTRQVVSSYMQCSLDLRILKECIKCASRLVQMVIIDKSGCIVFIGFASSLQYFRHHPTVTEAASSDRSTAFFNRFQALLPISIEFVLSSQWNKAVCISILCVRRFLKDRIDDSIANSSSHEIEMQRRQRSVDILLNAHNVVSNGRNVSTSITFSCDKEISIVELREYFHERKQKSSEITCNLFFCSDQTTSFSRNRKPRSKWLFNE